MNTPAAGTTNADTPFEVGEVISYAEERVVVMSNLGNCGAVMESGDEPYTATFYWRAHGEDCRRTGQRALFVSNREWVALTPADYAAVLKTWQKSGLESAFQRQWLTQEEACAVMARIAVSLGLIEAVEGRYRAVNPEQAAILEETFNRS